MTNKEAPIQLEGDAAVELWRQGVDAWNQWVKENPVANISFRGIDFSQYRAEGLPEIRFDNYVFPKGTVDFTNTVFGDGDVSFSEAKFGDGDVWFVGAEFGDGEVSFVGANFGDGEVSFSEANFGDGEVTFEKTHCQGHISFSSITNSQRITAFTLRHANFEKSLDLSRNDFGCVIDLTNTRMANQVSLEGLRCRLKRSWFGKAIDNRDSERLRRLKEIADSNKDHTQALLFHADEMRAMRWHETTFFQGLGLDYCYDWFSCYGQSIGRPMTMLVLITVLFGFFYQSKIPEPTRDVTVVDVMLYSASNILPFIPSSREIRLKGMSKLFGAADTRPYGLHAWVLLQGGLSFIFLFLVGLGLRNRFRI